MGVRGRSRQGTKTARSCGLNMAKTYWNSRPSTASDGAWCRPSSSPYLRHSQLVRVRDMRFWKRDVLVRAGAHLPPRDREESEDDD